MKKIVSLLVAILMSMLCFAAPVYADGDSDNDPAVIEIITDRSNAIPTDIHNLSTNGQYTLVGEAYGSADLYSNRLFTGTSLMGISVTNRGASHTITVKLYRRHNVGGNYPYSTYVTSFNVAPGHSNCINQSVSSYGYYYLSFSAPCIFDGYVI